MKNRCFRIKLALAGFVSLVALGDGVRLSPKFEGVYEVAVRCAKEPCGLNYKIDRAILMDEGRTGVRLNFLQASVPVPIYLLLANRIDRDGAHLEADAFLTNYRAVEWAGDIDPNSGALTGRLRDRALSGDLIVTGKILRSPGSQYQPQSVGVPLNPIDIKGIFKVSRSFDEGLTLRTTPSGNPPLVGTWRLWGTQIDFEDSELFQDQGVLVLYSRGPFSCLKWTVSLRRNAAGEVEGKVFSFSSLNGKYYRTSIKR